jgi:hypothetical protein
LAFLAGETIKPSDQRGTNLLLIGQHSFVRGAIEPREDRRFENVGKVVRVEGLDLPSLGVGEVPRGVCPSGSGGPRASSVRVPAPG